MIPVRDVVPSRTAPAVTLALLAALGAAFVWPPVREWWLPWSAHAVVVWIAGGTIEDRLGHARFAAFAALCAAAACAAPLAAGRDASLLWAACGAVAGLVAAHLVMFPQSRILTIVPVLVGVEVTDVPAWAVFGLWAVLQGAGAWSLLAWSPPADAIGMAASVAAGAAAGAVACLVLRRPERMRVDWWDPPTRQP
ncbi:MAG: rhomboid family intramembrane serine protease [Vicinamibacterales bacterium]